MSRFISSIINVDHFYEPKILQQILDENPETPPNMVSKIQSLIEQFDSNENVVSIQDWEGKFSLESGLAWEEKVF